MVVWSLPLPAGSEGPSLIPCAARLRSVGHHGLPPVPSWHTVIGMANPARERSRASIMNFLFRIFRILSGDVLEEDRSREREGLRVIEPGGVPYALSIEPDLKADDRG